jgi:hypothetical protein
MNAIDEMQRLIDLKVRELVTKNRSPIIDQINKEMGLPMGSPYCASTVSHCFREAFKANLISDPGAVFDETFPYSGGSQAIRRSFERWGKLSRDPQDLLAWKGALGGWTDQDDPAHGHIFFIKGRLTDNLGRVTGLRTLEANTSPDTMGRDGQGMFELVRRIDDLAKHHPNFWFCRTDDISGGEPWLLSPAGGPVQKNQSDK